MENEPGLTMETRLERVWVAISTLGVSAFLVQTMYPSHFTLRHVLDILVLWAAIYYALLSANLQTRLDKQRAQFTGWLTAFRITPEMCEEKRQEMARGYQIITRPYNHRADGYASTDEIDDAIAADRKAHE